MKLFTGIVSLFKNGEFSEEPVSATAKTLAEAEYKVIKKFKKGESKILKGRMKEDQEMNLDHIKRIGRMRSKTSKDAVLKEDKDGFLQSENVEEKHVRGKIKFLF